MKSEQVTYWYLEGITEGRTTLQEHGAQPDEAADRIANIKNTIKMFASNSPAGQMLRGELDFWLNQQKRLKKKKMKFLARQYKCSGDQ